MQYLNENSKKVVQRMDIVVQYAFEKINENAEEPILMAQMSGELILEHVKAEYAAYLENAELGKEDWEFVRKYVLLARAAMEEGYVPSYTGMSGAMRIYNPLFEYYYDLVQLEHIEQIESALSRYETAQTFIDKKGICVYVENYLFNNDIDFTREDIQQIEARVAEIRAQM